MSVNTMIVLIAATAALAFFAFGQWLNADIPREPGFRAACERLGTC